MPLKFRAWELFYFLIQRGKTTNAVQGKDRFVALPARPVGRRRAGLATGGGSPAAFFAAGHI